MAAVLGGSAGYRLRARKRPHAMGVADALAQQGRGKSPGRGWAGSDSNGSDPQGGSGGARLWLDVITFGNRG